MADFTCALYLGMWHGSDALPPWSSLTTGKPAALEEAPLTRHVTGQLAGLIGCERAVLLPSTLHAFVDLFGMLGNSRVAVYVDAGTYPIARWGIERIACRGVPVRFFPTHDPAALQRLLKRNARSRLLPIVVADGVWPARGQPAPLADYLDTISSEGGLLVMDDTQGLGILGHDPSVSMPYGHGGGGILQWSATRNDRVLIVSSLAKAFGVPVAVLAGSRRWLDVFDRRSDTRVHCSPPCAAVIHAAQRALEVNATHGDALRQRVIQLVRRFRNGLANLGLTVNGQIFPVQTLDRPSGPDAKHLHTQLLAHGIHAVLRRGERTGSARLSFLITARHTESDIEHALAALADVSAAMNVNATEMMS